MEIQQINCPICMQIFRRPTTISCGHTFCYSCLTNSIRDNRSCPICRHHVETATNKIGTDQSVQQFVQHYKTTIKKQENIKKQNHHTECKAERLLLIDIVTNDLLLPFNKITATFELQSNVLIDRMERFVARQQIPYNNYSVVCRLAHIEEIRRNLYKGVLEGKAFCTIDSQEVQSELSLEADQEEFFFRTCKSKEISESTDTNPAEFNAFFLYFNRIEEEYIKKLIYTKIDPLIFTQRNDLIAIFYSILGIIDLDNDKKYKIAINFDEEFRINKIKQYLVTNEKRIKQNASNLIKISVNSGGGDKRFVILLILLFCMFLFAKSQSQDL